jgi:hypothetical protein
MIPVTGNTKSIEQENEKARKNILKKYANPGIQHSFIRTESQFL